MCCADFQTPKTDCVLLREMSIPRSCNASTAKGLRTPGSNPALWASKYSPHISLSNAAAIWLRALFCTQIKRTFFFTGPNVNRNRTQLKPSVGLSPERHIALGSTIRIVVPLSSSLSASTRPPCNCAMCFTIARPRPVPRTLSGLRALSAR